MQPLEKEIPERKNNNNNELTIKNNLFNPSKNNHPSDFVKNLKSRIDRFF